jgi:hypothetical protein
MEVTRRRVRVGSGHQLEKALALNRIRALPL